MFESEILNIMTVFPGGMYSAEKIPEQKVLICNLYKRNGFPKSQVTIESKKDPDDNYFTLAVRIDKGISRDLGKIMIEGNNYFWFWDFRLKYHMKTWRRKVLTAGMGWFTGEMFKQDVKKLLSMYRKAGFAESNIDHELVYRKDSMVVDMHIKISEGPRYKIKYDGNIEFSGWWTLRKDVNIYKRGNLNNSGLLKSKRDMLKRYNENGYQNAKIYTSDSLRKRNEIKQVTFHISEGAQSKVESISFNGGDNLDKESLNDQILTRVGKPFVPQVLEEDLQAVLSVCRYSGYPQCTVDDVVAYSDDKTKVRIVINFKEKGFRKLGRIDISGLDSIIDQEKVYTYIKASKGEPFRKNVLMSDIENLSAEISELGYPHVSIEVDTLVGSDKQVLDVVYRVDPGPKVFMGDYFFSGNFRTRESYLKNEVDLESGERFSLTELLQGQKQVQDHTIFRSVYFKTVGLKEKSDRVHLFIEVEEKKPRYLQLGGGYESERGFFTQSKYGNRNVFGTNKHAWVGGEFSQIGYRTETGITEPRLFRTRVAATFEVYYEDKQEHNITWGVKTFGSSLGFNRRWFTSLISGLTFTYERKDVYGDVTLDAGSDTAAVLAATKPRNTLVTTPSLIYDTRNSFIRPGKGMYSSLSMDFSRGIDNRQDDFIKYEYELRKYITFFSPLTIAAAGKFGFIHTRHDDMPVSEDLFFFMGGTNSIRGFAENSLNLNSAGDPVGNVRAVSLNTELRWDIGLNIELCGFYDIGQLHQTLLTNFSENYRMSSGGGIRYITPIGPIGILYGRKLRKKAGESSGQFHFSLGYTF